MAEDDAVKARLVELAAPLEEIRSKVVASTEVPIGGDRAVCRAGACEMGVLVADAMLDRVKSQGVDIAITNGGGLRASIDAGEITMGEVLTVLPFQNTLSTFRLSGADVVAALENGVSQVEKGAGRFPQVAGLKFTFDAKAPVGARISDVMVADGKGGWVPLDPEGLYGVVSNNYMRSGGDGYAVLATDAIDPYDYGPPLDQVVADYLAAHAPYTPYTDDRISAK